MDYHGVTKNRTQLSDFTFTLASAQSGVWSPNTSPEPQPWNSLPVWPSQAGGHFLPSPPARGRPYLRRPGRLYTFLCCGLIATAPRESQRRPRRKETAEEDAANRLTAPSRPVRRPHPSGGRARPWLRLGGGREGSPLPPVLNVFCFYYVHTISVLYRAHLCTKCSLSISNFLEAILVFPILLFSSISLH